VCSRRRELARLTMRELKSKIALFSSCCDEVPAAMVRGERQTGGTVKNKKLRAPD